jgi:hypothetical protein
MVMVRDDDVMMEMAEKFGCGDAHQQKSEGLTHKSIA